MLRHFTVVCLMGLWGLAVVWGEAARAAPGNNATPPATRRHQVVQACEKAALALIRRQSPRDVQQVDLGDEGNPHSLALTDGALLTGTGQIRQDVFWHDFYFSCEVSPDSGEVLTFSYTLIS